ncbi:MAG: NAD(P)H-hydrate dehydratase [Ginsengibacter sp.]
MKIFSVAQTKSWDAYTIHHEKIKSIDLMERAATAAFEWITENFDEECHFKIFCGRGNNGGDGLAVARLLNRIKFKASVFIPFSNTPGSADFETNFKRLKQTSVEILFLKEDEPFPKLTDQDVIVDALFGTGLNRKPEGIYARLIDFINSAPSKKISIDVPSGLFIEKSSVGNNVIKANHTLTFQNQKLAFLLPENETYVGQVILLDIGLSDKFEKIEEAQFEFVDGKMIHEIYKPRKDFANKGSYGYACLLAGSYGMMGAAVLSSSGCLRSGVGKLTSCICEAGYAIMQTSVPEAMCKIYGDKYIKDFDGFSDYDVIGIGPGIGKYDSHKKLLQELFTNCTKPLVIDADALNVLSENPELYHSIPPKTVITPHPKEFERLFGKTESDFDRINLALSKAKELNIFIVLKGHYTFIATPGGKGYFNSTGNAGMATAGAGDVLTGIITGFLAQKYSVLSSCIMGVYLHGLSGDIAAKHVSKEALIARDIVENLGKAFKKIAS